MCPPDGQYKKNPIVVAVCVLFTHTHLKLLKNILVFTSHFYPDTGCMSICPILTQFSISGSWIQLIIFRFTQSGVQDQSHCDHIFSNLSTCLLVNNVQFDLIVNWLVFCGLRSSSLWSVKQIFSPKLKFSHTMYDG